MGLFGVFGESKRELSIFERNFAMAESKPLIFDGKNFSIWAIKMECFLMGCSLWGYVENDITITELKANPTLAQIRLHEEAVAKKHKALSNLHNAVSEELFTRIITCKTAKEA